MRQYERDERPAQPPARTGSGRLTRRRLLADIGAAGSAGLAGCSFLDPDDESETPTAGPTTAVGPTTGQPQVTESDGETIERLDAEPPESLPFADEYETLVDVVEAGADPTGEEPIEDVLTAEAGPNALLYFPPGRYRIGSRWDLPAFENFAMVGGPATFVPERGYTGYLLQLGWDGGGQRARFENFTFDFGGPDVGARPLQILADDLAVRDVSVSGRQNRGRGMMRFDVTNPDGTGVVERLHLPDGAVVGTGTVGCLVGPASTGTITFRDCRIEGFPNNGLYASPAKGPVRVLGGYYANNGIASVRVSGDSVVRGVHVRCDDDGRHLDNMRGIRLRHGASALVEDCTVEMLAATYSDGAITMEPLLQSATVRDTVVRADVDEVPAIRIKSPTRSIDRLGESDGDPRIRVENVRITGSAGTRSTVEVVDRDDCRFDGLCVRQTGPDRDGFHLVRSHHNVLSHALIDVTGRPFVLENSPLRTVDVTVANATGNIPNADGTNPC